MKSNEKENASKLIENTILGDSSAHRFLLNNEKLVFFIKNELTFLPGWRKGVNFISPDKLLDGLLKWWSDSNDLKDRSAIKRLCVLTNGRGSNPWKFINGNLINNSHDFLITMASVLVEEGENIVAENCLKQLWKRSADLPLPYILRESNLKAIIKKAFKPQVLIAYDYGMLDNWIQISNLSKFTLHDIRITILISFRDDKKSERLYRSSAQLQPNANLSFKDDVFPGCGLSGRKYLTFWKSNIAHVNFVVSCAESKLLDGQIVCRSQKGKNN